MLTGFNEREEQTLNSVLLILKDNQISYHGFYYYYLTSGV